MTDTTEQLANELYTTYCDAVGGKAFNGDPLPDWATFSTDPAKTKQADAWRWVANVVVLKIALLETERDTLRNMVSGGLGNELIAWLDKQAITSENIGTIRRQCFMPWDSKWNMLVRDQTAMRENKPPKA